MDGPNGRQSRETRRAAGTMSPVARRQTREVLRGDVQTDATGPTDNPTGENSLCDVETSGAGSASREQNCAGRARIGRGNNTERRTDQMSWQQITCGGSRMCICDRHVCPYPREEGLLQHCPNCIPHKDEWNCRQCPEHTLITCSAGGCQKQFHKSCLQSYGHIELGYDSSEPHNYTCMACDNWAQRHETIGGDTLEGQLTPGELVTKLQPIGHKMPEGADTNAKKRLKRMYDKMTTAMRRLMTEKAHRQLEPRPQEDDDRDHSDLNVQQSPDDCQELLDTDPRHHPCPVKMNDDSKETVLLAGPRFTVSM